MDDTNFTAPPPAAPTPDGAGMRKLNDQATKIFMTLVDGLRVGDAKKIDNAKGAFMAVSVDFLVGEQLRTASGPPWALYAIAHNYLANGDLIPDPDVEFYVVDDPDRPTAKAVYPIAIDHGPLGYHRYADLVRTGQLSNIRAAGQGELARFCDVWMKNIAAQQRLEVR
jgi:hypothetical protein